LESLHFQHLNQFASSEGGDTLCFGERTSYGKERCVARLEHRLKIEPLSPRLRRKYRGITREGNAAIGANRDAPRVLVPAFRTVDSPSPTRVERVKLSA